MNGYFNYKDELMHYGVLGMRWGVRRYQSYSTVPRESGKRGKEIGDAKLSRRDKKRISKSIRKSYNKLYAANKKANKKGASISRSNDLDDALEKAKSYLSKDQRKQIDDAHKDYLKVRAFTDKAIESYAKNEITNTKVFEGYIKERKQYENLMKVSKDVASQLLGKYGDKTINSSMRENYFHGQKTVNDILARSIRNDLTQPRKAKRSVKPNDIVRAKYA